MMNRWIWIISLTVATCVAASFGCNRGDARRASVSGMVTVDGEALATGVISFQPAEGHTGPAVGAEIKEGGYTIVRAQGTKK